MVLQILISYIAGCDCYGIPGVKSAQAILLVHCFAVDMSCNIPGKPMHRLRLAEQLCLDEVFARWLVAFQYAQCSITTPDKPHIPTGMGL